MPIRCRAEHDGDGIALSDIESAAHAESLRCFFAERGIAAMVTQPHGHHDYRLYLAGLTMGVFVKLLAGANIELIP